MNCPLTSPEGAAIGRNKKVIVSVLDKSKNLVLWQRSLNTFLESWASELKWEKIQLIEANLRLADLDHFEESLLSEINVWRTRSPDLNNWVANDVRSIVEDFIRSTGAIEVYLSLSVIENEMCRLFHVDKNKLRLLCTYVGQGTIWLPNVNIDREQLENGLNQDIVLDPLQVYQAQSLDVLILKGESWADNLHCGAVHRSPALISGEKRLLLKVDFIN